MKSAFLFVSDWPNLRSQTCAHTLRSHTCAHKPALTHLRSQPCAHHLRFTNLRSQPALTHLRSQTCAHNPALTCAHTPALHTPALTNLRSHTCAHKPALTHLRSHTLYSYSSAHVIMRISLRRETGVCLCLPVSLSLLTAPDVMNPGSSAFLTPLMCDAAGNGRSMTAALSLNLIAVRRCLPWTIHLFIPSEFTSVLTQ